MQTRTPFRPAALVLALAMAGLAPGAQALNIVFRDVGSAAMSSQQYAAFETAASYWESKLTDNVTVYISIAFDDLGGSTLGTTTWAKYQTGYSTLKTRLTADKTSAVDTAAVNSLQAGPALSFIGTNYDQTRGLDNNASNNNRFLWLTTANAKALGFNDTATEFTSPDATIKFSTGFAGNFAYSRSNGQVPAGKLDFITVAEHEIGHALGFASGVDGIDNCIGNGAQCGTNFDADVWFYSLDLYRYSAPGVLDLSVVPQNSPNQPYFSLDGGATSIHGLATGEHHGDGAQASHFIGSPLTLMNPTVPYGMSYDATNADLMALDAIGWNLANPVPEPETYALLLSGLAVLGWAGRRRRG